MSALYPDLDFTNYPNAIDNIVSKSNITNASDAQLVEQIQKLILSGDFASASAILNANPSLNSKIFNANDYNQLRDSIIALERFYKTDVYDYITQKQAEWASTFENFNYRGVYSPSVQYNMNNLVTYTSLQGTLMYICIKTPEPNTPPTNTTYWKVFTVRGERGDTGAGLSFTWIYNNTTQYNTDDIVVYDGKWWIATQPNIGQLPVEGSAYWTIMLTALPALQIPVTNVQPTNQTLGDQWYREI